MRKLENTRLFCVFLVGAFVVFCIAMVGIVMGAMFVKPSACGRDSVRKYIASMICGTVSLLGSLVMQGVAVCVVVDLA